MSLKAITARAHAAGNRIDLVWENPRPEVFPGVRVVRRQDRHPAAPDDGVVVAHGERLTSATDTGLHGETVYYYTLFPFKGEPPEYEEDPRNRVSAMATAPYDLAGRMYDLLPAIYRRYDAARTPSPDSGVTVADMDKGELRRFLDLPGAEFDRLYSMARAALNFHDPDRVEGQLLPLLAEWIGWETDHNLDVDAQRNEIRFAPHIYHAVGLAPTVEATVKRIIGWESRTKEFVHNVACTNQPARLNLWSMLRDAGGAWEKAELASTNWVFEGRPAVVREADGSLLFLYHTRRRHGWDIWAKRFVGGEQPPWQPSAPVVDQPGIDKHPAAALQDDRLWLFWENLDPAEPQNRQHWRIAYRMRDHGAWSPVEIFGDDATERRLPAAAVDSAGGLWLFWLERSGSGWQVKFNRHDGTRWQLDTPMTLPTDQGQDPRVEEDLLLFIHPTSATRPLWLFWARREPGGSPGQTRWRVVGRAKQGLDPSAADWSPVAALPKSAPGNYDDREPAALAGPGNTIELFWSSNRKDGWSVWHNTLDVTTLSFGTAEQVTTSPYSERAPLAVGIGTGVLLTYRSSESLEHTSKVYSATRMLDMRYAGTTTVDTANLAKMALRGRFEDFQTYTYDAGQQGVRTNDTWYARDTVGIFLTPDTEDRTLIIRNRNRIRDVLRNFLPIQVRPVFIIEQPINRELIYTYDYPAATPERRIGEQYADTLSSLAASSYAGLRDTYQDTMPDWVFIRTWSTATRTHHTVDVRTQPIDTRYRTWHVGVKDGG